MMKKIITFMILLVVSTMAKEGKYYLGHSNYVEAINAPNTDKVCKAYVDALNEHPPVVDFFESPAHPDSKEFTYPKWEQLDIMKNKETYLNVLRFNFNKDINKGRYFYMQNISEYTSLPPYVRGGVESFNRSRQMYHAIADIDNDGSSDQIIKIAKGKTAYDWSRYRTTLTVFKSNKMRAIDSF